MDAAPDLPQPEELSEPQLREKFAQEFGRHLEAMHIPESSPHAARALELRTAIERRYESVHLMMDGVGVPPDALLQRIQDAWEEMWEALMELIELQAIHLQEEVMLLSGNDVSGRDLIDRIEDAFDMEGMEHIRESLATCAEEAQKDPFGTGGRYFPGEGRIDGKAVAHDEKIVDDTLAIPHLTEEQRASLEHLKAMLHAIGNAENEVYKRQRFVQESKENYRASPIAQNLRMAAAIGSAFLAVWSLRSKNPHLSALYGGISILLIRPDFLKNTTQKELIGMQKISTPALQDVRYRHLRGLNGAKAVEEFYDLREHGTKEEKDLLQALIRKREVSMAQASTLCGGETPLYNVLQGMATDKERHDALWQLQQLPGNAAAAFTELLRAEEATPGF